jgi:hypothetical protein
MRCLLASTTTTGVYCDFDITERITTRVFAAVVLLLAFIQKEEEYACAQIVSSSIWGKRFSSQSKRRKNGPRAGNVLAVKKALRHKRVENTMKYIHRLEFQDPQDYDVAIAATIEEIKHLAQEGFQKFDEVNGVHIYRRPKKYRS